MTRRTKKLAIVVAGAAIAILLLTPLPFPLNDRDKEAAVSHAVKALIGNRRVLTHNGFDTGKGYRRLEDASLVSGKKPYFANDLGIPDTVFLKRGLKPAPRYWRLHREEGVAVIAFSNRDIPGNATQHVQFAYILGPLGAQGYEIRIYKSLLIRYFVYAHRWVS
jgi:hypothetical protein